jgi:hypothetical protein
MNDKILNVSEVELLNHKEYNKFINIYIKYRQFSEEFLTKTIDYYDSWNCLKYQKNLSPYFCFRYLYDNKTDSADNWTDYNDIINYLSKQDKKYSEEEINFYFKKALNERK